MTIFLININKKCYLDLLLLGDEQESMIDRCLERGKQFVFEDNGAKAVCVVTDEGNGVCELKNIAVSSSSQWQGYGKRMINYLMDYYRDKYDRMTVGTGDVPGRLGLYQSYGFEFSHRIENFFTGNYDHPIIEEGVLLKDMVYLKRKMKTDFVIREAQKCDALELKELYRNTVLTINRCDYSQAEVEAWGSCGDDLAKWEVVIDTHYFVVAVNRQFQRTGFSSVTPQGYLHSMFIIKVIKVEEL